MAHDVSPADYDILVNALRVSEAARLDAEETVRQVNGAFEERVAERTAALDAINEELESFTYSVAHDLRSPVRHMDGFSRLLLEECGGDLPDAARHYVGRIRASAIRMGRLIDDMLTLAQVGRAQLHRRDTGLRTIVDDVIADLAADEPGRLIDWRILDLPSVACDPGLVRQVFANLLSNAVKFTRPRDRAVIEVGAAMCAGQAAVYVRDNGVGFSMQYAGKLFGVFQRLHREEDFEGTGVGLAIVQRIVHKHGGTIWAEAAVDAGATFFFTFGADAGSGPPAPDRPSPGSDPRGPDDRQ
jgi:light-regulated signal transduction histidine kinase (bacteriophytochrome)